MKLNRIFLAAAIVPVLVICGTGKPAAASVAMAPGQSLGLGDRLAVVSKSGIIQARRRGGRGYRGGGRGFRGGRRGFRGYRGGRGYRGYRRYGRRYGRGRGGYRRYGGYARPWRRYRRRYRRGYSFYAYPYYWRAPRYAYSNRCVRWRRRCAANWGFGNANYYGCMRYHGCR